MKRILLGQLASFGDCLYATTVARQIKHDFPGCHLTWAIGSSYRSIIEENPHVDEIWEVPLFQRDDMESAWREFEVEAKRKLQEGLFDEIVLTQINPNNYQNFDGTVRSSIFRGYHRPITVPVNPVLRLRSDEIEHVRCFAQENALEQRKQVILFECSAKSNQSYVTPEFALDVAKLLINQFADCAIILSSNEKVSTSDSRIIDGSVLTIRENAELTKYCMLFIGCSSGISWLCTSDWAKPLPMIQLLKRSTSVFASPTHDAEYFGLPTDHIIEMTDCPVQRLVECITATMRERFSVVRNRFHEQIPVELNLYLEKFMKSQLRQGHPLKVMRSLSHVMRRYGFQPFGRYLQSKVRFQ